MCLYDGPGTLFRGFASIQKAIRINGNVGSYWVYLGDIYENLNFDAALTCLVKAKDGESSNDEVPVMLAVCYYKLGQLDQASDQLTLAILKKQESKDTFFELCPEAKNDPLFVNFDHSN